MGNIKKFFTVFSAMVMCSSLSVYAAPSTGAVTETETVDGDDTTDRSTDADVIYRSPEQFSVIIPKGISFNGGEDNPAQPFTITLKGNLSGTSCVKVASEKNFVIKQDGKEDVNVRANYKHVWPGNTITEEGTSYNGKLVITTANGNKLSAGVWEGEFNFYITFSDTLIDIPGLYASDGSMVKDWDELKDENIVQIESDGVMYADRAWFKNNTSNNKLVIGDEVKQLHREAGTYGKGMFEQVSGLTEVVLPDNLEVIDSDAFHDCTNLARINIPDNVTTIGNSAFHGTKLEQIELPDSVTYIGTNVFNNCRSLVSVVLPEDYNSIPDYTFLNCASLQNINVPDAITSIGDQAFRGTNLQSIDLPDHLETIGNSAFTGMKFSEIDIPNTVTTIKANAFSSCTQLTDVTIPESVTTLGRGVFDSCTGLRNIVLPSTLTVVEQELFQKCYALTNITIPDTVKTIGTNAFAYCSSLSSVDIPDSVTTINSGAFSGCTSLEGIVIPGNVTYVANKAFWCDGNLHSAVINGGITRIYNCTLWECDLTSLTLPGTLTRIDDYAFRGDTLTEITFNGTMDAWNAISIDARWTTAPITTIHCTDGDITL